MSMFSPGEIVITPAALNSLSPDAVKSALERHLAGDWGDLCLVDVRENELALVHDRRLFSVYHIDGIRFWIITEADRSSTTILLPDDY